MTIARISIVTTLMLLLTTFSFSAERHPGSAVVRVADSEYLIPIDCYVAYKPELGFSTEPSRITRETTGRNSMIRLTVRPWRETTELVISLDRYVAWVPTKPSAGGILEMTLDMSPTSILVDGMPAALTFDRWQAGERPDGISGVSFTANCNQRDPDAPAFRKL